MSDELESGCEIAPRLLAQRFASAARCRPQLADSPARRLRNSLRSIAPRIPENSLHSSHVARIGVASDRLLPTAFILTAMALSATASAQSLATGDTRSVTTPTYPAVCATVPAQFK